MTGHRIASMVKGVVPGMGLSPGLGVEVRVEWRKWCMKSGIAIQPMAAVVDLFHLLKWKQMLDAMASVVDSRLAMMLGVF
jgi:hypothetical protein